MLHKFLIFLIWGEDMSLYGHTNINIEALKRWVNALSVDTVKEVDVGGHLISIEKEWREVLELQLEGFSAMINILNEGQDWRECQGILSLLFYNAFIRVDNSSIRIADYFECKFQNILYPD